VSEGNVVIYVCPCCKDLFDYSGCNYEEAMRYLILHDKCRDTSCRLSSDEIADLEEQLSNVEVFDHPGIKTCVRCGPNS
jgi:hypothetical protein